MVEPLSSLSIHQQCKILSINRSNYYYKSKGESAFNLELMKLIDQLYLRYPFYGSRQMRYHLRKQGYFVSRKRLQRLMRKMGIVAIYQKPHTSKQNVEHKIYPYLLRNLTIHKANQVWCADISYIPMRHGFIYLVAIMDWYSRKVLSWRLSNTLDTLFCIEALQEALDIYSCPEIFNTDRGAQFTSQSFTEELSNLNIKISMDGKGCWMDNVFIERLWRSLKYECIYLLEFDSAREAKEAIRNWFNFYNNNRPHSAFNGQTPRDVYNAEYKVIKIQKLAA